MRGQLKAAKTDKALQGTGAQYQGILWRVVDCWEARVPDRLLWHIAIRVSGVISKAKY